MVNVSPPTPPQEDESIARQTAVGSSYTIPTSAVTVMIGFARSIILNPNCQRHHFVGWLKLWRRLEAYLRYAGENNRLNLGRINAILINFVARSTRFTLGAFVLKNG